MALLDMLQLPGGASGAPDDEPFYDPLSGLPMRGAPKRARWPESPPPDPNAWNPGASPIPFPGMLSNDVNAALPKQAPPLPAANVPSLMNPPPPPSVPMAASPQAPPAAALPPSSTPTSGPVKLPDSVPDTSLMGRLGEAFGKIGDRLHDRAGTLVAMGSGMMGAQSIGQGLSRGFAAAGPAYQQDIKLQQQNQTVGALIKRGIPQDVALAAAGNPAIMQQLIGQVFGPKAYQHVTVKNAAGDEVPLIFDPAAGKYKTASGEAYGSPSAASGTQLHGQPFLDTQDPSVRDDIKAMAEGRLPSAGFGAQKNLLPKVAQYDPNFDATQYPNMLKVRTNYTSGKQFQEIQAINTVAGHLDNLSKSADDLNNTRFPWVNTALNMASQATGDPRVDKFNTDKQAVTNELSKAYRGGHVTEGDVREWQSNISAAKSPEQLKAVIGEMNELLNSKRQALEDGYRSGMGKAPLPEEFSSVSKHAGEVFNRVADWSHGVKGEKPAAPAAPAAASPVIKSKTDYDKLPSGATFTGEDGKPYRKP